MNKQRGFTLAELVAVLVTLLVGALVLGVAVALWKWILS